jgi:hypothetical protein
MDAQGSRHRLDVPGRGVASSVNVQVVDRSRSRSRPGGPNGLPGFTRILEWHEGERRRIARELHDEIGGTLMWLRCIGDAARSAGSSSGQGKHRDDNTAGPRHHTRPAGGATRFTTLTGVQVHFTHVGFDRRLPTSVETAVLRVVQEALTNVAKHARTPDVNVAIQRCGYGVSLLVEDHEAGFDARQRTGDRESGLAATRHDRGARSTAIDLGGRCVGKRPVPASAEGEDSSHPGAPRGRLCPGVHAGGGLRCLRASRSVTLSVGRVNP